MEAMQPNGKIVEALGYAKAPGVTDLGQGKPEPNV